MERTVEPQRFKNEQKERFLQKNYVAKVKKYKDGTLKITKYNEEKLKTVGMFSDNKDFFDQKNDELTEEERTQKEAENEERRNRYCFEVKNRIFDLLKNNSDVFGKSYFCTFTFDPKKEKGLSLNEKNELRYVKMKHWLQNQRVQAKRKNQEFDYLVVPELHEGDGENHGTIHFHGVIGATKKNAFLPKMEKTKVKFKGDDVFNLVSFKHGFTNATKVQDLNKVASYVKKYITKELLNSPVSKGKRKYWASNGLDKPKVEYLDIDEIQNLSKTTKKTSQTFVGEKVKIWEAQDLEFENRPSFDETFKVVKRS